MVSLILPNFIFILFTFKQSICFATDEDGCAVENFCNTLFKCIYNLHEEMFCLIVKNKRYDCFDFSSTHVRDPGGSMSLGSWIT